MAKGQGWNIVASPTDDFFAACLYAGREGTLKPGALVDALFSTGDEEASLDGTWLQIMPSAPSLEIPLRPSRTQLAGPLRSIANSKHVSLEDAAALALSCSGESCPSLPLTILQLLGVDTMRLQVLDWTMLKLYATFLPDQMQVLNDKEPLAFGKLSAEQMNLVSHLLYDKAKLIQAKAGVDLNDPLSVAGASSTQGAAEPTESLPDGLSPAQALRLIDMSGDSLYASPRINGVDYGLRAVDPRWVAEILNRKKDGMELTGIKTGFKRSLSFRFLLGGELYLLESLEEDQPANTPLGSVDGLPDEWQKKIAAERQAMTSRTGPPPVQ
jgi:hypothetical protein